MKAFISLSYRDNIELIKTEKLIIYKLLLFIREKSPILTQVF